jgi:hypothetical protein
MPKHRVRSESGFALITALIIMLIIAMLDVAVVNVALSEYATASGNAHAMQAFFLAQGGLERALTVLRTDKDWSHYTSAWQLLDMKENGGEARDKGFPPDHPIGTYTIFVSNPIGKALPDVPCPGLGAGGSDPVNNAWVRVVGRVGRAARTVEALAHRLTAGDLTAYAANVVALSDPKAMGARSISIHGSLYARGSLGSQGAKTSLYNDRPLFRGEPDTGYCNQLFLTGSLDMTMGAVTVGTSLQPMWGVHAPQIYLNGAVADWTQSVHTRYLGNDVPRIPYPDVQAFVNAVRTPCSFTHPLCYVNAFDPDAIDPETGMVGGSARLVTCYEDAAGHLQMTLQQDLELASVLDLGGSRVSYRALYLPTQAFWRAVGKCEDPARRVSAAQPGNHVLSWEPPRGPLGGSGILTFNSALRGFPILVNGRLRIGMDVSYSGTGTIVIDPSSATDWVVDAGSEFAGGPCPGGLGCRIRASRPASQGFSCPFSTSMPCQDLAVFIVNGSVRANKQEVDAVIVAGREGSDHIFMALNQVQLYGLVIANELDTSQALEVFQVPDIASAMPFPLSYLLGGSGGTVVYSGWREIF